jgi:hypothetical protein
MSAPANNVPFSSRMQSLKLFPLNANTTTCGWESRRSCANDPSSSHGAMPPHARTVTFMSNADATGVKYGPACTTSESP